MSDQLDSDPNDEEMEREVIEHELAMTDRSVARRLALQVLYEIDSAGHPVGEVIASHLDQGPFEKRSISYLRRLVDGVLSYRLHLDKIIEQYAPEWPLQQVAVVDRNILRIAIYELATQARTPVRVAINEAVELADIFGAEGASRFVNGVLGSLAQDVDGLRQVFASANGETKS